LAFSYGSPSTESEESTAKQMFVKPGVHVALGPAVGVSGLADGEKLPESVGTTDGSGSDDVVGEKLPESVGTTDGSGSDDADGEELAEPVGPVGGSNDAEGAGTNDGDSLPVSVGEYVAVNVPLGVGSVVGVAPKECDGESHVGVGGAETAAPRQAKRHSSQAVLPMFVCNAARGP